MKDALIKLSADNLANLVPHPIFSWFNYSHPPPVERIERLEKKGTGKLLLFNCGPVPNTFSQERSTPFALCPLLYALCCMLFTFYSLLYAPCPLLFTLYSMLHVPCAMLSSP
jgi:hypothetical protein